MRSEPAPARASTARLDWRVDARAGFNPRESRGLPLRRPMWHPGAAASPARPSSSAHRLGLAIGRPAAGLHSSSQGMKRGGEDFGLCPRRKGSSSSSHAASSDWCSVATWRAARMCGSYSAKPNRLRSSSSCSRCLARRARHRAPDGPQSFGDHRADELWSARESSGTPSRGNPGALAPLSATDGWARAAPSGPPRREGGGTLGHGGRARSGRA